MAHFQMVYLLNMVIFHGYVSHNQRVLLAHGSERTTKKFDVSVTSSEIKLSHSSWLMETSLETSLRLLGLTEGRNGSREVPQSSMVIYIHLYRMLVGGLEHLFFHILGIIIPTDFHFFSEGLKPSSRTPYFGGILNLWYLA